MKSIDEFTDDDIAKASEVAGADRTDLENWLRGRDGSRKAKWFFDKIAALPQRKAVRDCDAIAFLHSMSFNRKLLGMSRDRRREAVESIVARLPFITPRQAAAIACEIRGHRVFTFRTADAEFIRRSLLLRNPCDFGETGRKNRLLSIARREMLKRACAECSVLSPSPANPTIMDGLNFGQVMTSQTETLIRAQDDGKSLWHPCILQTDQDPHLTHYKLAVLAMCAPETENVRDGVVVSISEKDFEIRADIIEKELFLDYVPEMLEGVRSFFAHVMNDIPCEYCVKNPVALDAETSALLVEGYRKTAAASLVRRAAEEREKDLRSRLDKIMYDVSRSTGVPVSRLIPPRGAMTPARMSVIDQRALDEMIRRHPDAEREICGEEKPDFYSMQRKLIELGVPESEWTRPVVSAPKVAAYCRMRNLPLPGRDCVRFDLSKDKREREEVERLVSPHLSALGFGGE